MLTLVAMGFPASQGVRLASLCLELCELGSAVALGGYRNDPSTEEKDDNDLVTPFDKATELAILEALEQRLPGAAVVAEESSAQGVALPAGLCFAIDPIDGTTNFAHGHPFWAVVVGVLFDGQPLAGALVAPALGLRYWGHVTKTGGEAFRNGQPCRVSKRSLLSSSLLATGFPPVRDTAPQNNFDSFMRVKKACRAVRRCGAAALDIAFVADGTYDGYWERRLHVWDAAASAALVLAAGGKITSLSGREARLSEGHIAVSNGLIHDELLAAVGEA